jgi:hypothetical protein
MHETPYLRLVDEKPKPRKEPIIVSVMPEKAFPEGHEDFRPLLQRDGLILLSWAVWQDWGGDCSLRFVVTWVASSGRRHCHFATNPITKRELAGAAPERRADALFYKGLYGCYHDERDYQNKDIADYLYLVAPFDLDSRTIPRYIRVLEALGSTVNYDAKFTISKVKKTQAEEYLERFEREQKHGTG